MRNVKNVCEIGGTSRMPVLLLCKSSFTRARTTARLASSTGKTLERLGFNFNVYSSKLCFAFLGTRTLFHPGRTKRRIKCKRDWSVVRKWICLAREACGNLQVWTEKWSIINWQRNRKAFAQGICETSNRVRRLESFTIPLQEPSMDPCHWMIDCIQDRPYKTDSGCDGQRTV